MRPLVNVTDLLDKLEENRSRHREVFEAALAGWHEQATEKIAAMAAELKAGRYPNLTLNLPLPIDQTRDYDRAIVMVHMHQGDTIELSESDTAQFIQDDWSWKRQWLHANSVYAAGAVNKVYGGYDEEELVW